MSGWVVGSGSSMARWNWARAAGASAVAAVVVAIPSDLLDTPWFTRMTPTRPWDYAVAVATILLTGSAAGLGARGPRPRRGPECGPQHCPPVRDRGRVGSGPVAAIGAVALAVGCPVCNKIVVLLLGVSGALELWSPLQPVLGVVAVLLLVVIVAVRAYASRVGRDGLDVIDAGGAALRDDRTVDHDDLTPTVTR